MKKIFWIILVVVAIAVGVFFFQVVSEREDDDSDNSGIGIFNFGSENKTTLSADKIVLYFANNQIDPDFVDCSQLQKVERASGGSGNDKYRYALTQLLLGPSGKESEAGFSTMINPGVRIQDISFTEGEINVDFSTELDNGVAGSCMVTAIRAQITDTLKQFPEVKNVVISISGKRDDILQP